MMFVAACVAILIAVELDYRRQQRRARRRAFYGNTPTSTRRPFPK